MDIVVDEVAVDLVGGDDGFVHDILGDGFELGDIGGAFQGIDGVSVAEFVGGLDLLGGKFERMGDVSKTALSNAAFTREYSCNL